MPGFVDHLETPYAVAVLVHVEHRLGGDVHMGLGVDASRNGESHQLELGPAMVACVGIAACAHNPALHGANARIQIELGGQGLCGELDLRHAGVEATRIEEYCVPSHGLSKSKLRNSWVSLTGS